jgi:predicted regulator of Ras-like GTPase activity (Roadblock/LC7/MglB family)
MNDDRADALASQLAPYREHPGVKAALLISRDGFLVAAAADESVNAEAVAAQLGAVVDVAARLAGELGQEAATYITFELSALNAVLSPFGGGLLLALIGTPDVITLQYGFAGGRV